MEFRSAHGLRHDDLLVVVSQSCDVLSDNFDAEPYVELQVAVPIDKVDGGYMHGKNPRVIDFTVSGVIVRCHDAKRMRADRRMLIGITPSGTLDGETLRTLIRWTADRYLRAALPDEFNNRRRSIQDRLEKLAKRAHMLTAVLLTINTDEELPPESSYNILLTGTILPDTAARPVQMKDATKIMGELVALFKSVDGINVVEDPEQPLVRSEDEVSIWELRHLKRLPFEYLSRRFEDAESPPPG